MNASWWPPGRWRVHTWRLYCRWQRNMELLQQIRCWMQEHRFPIYDPFSDCDRCDWCGARTGEAPKQGGSFAFPPRRRHNPRRPQRRESRSITFPYMHRRCGGNPFA